MHMVLSVIQKFLCLDAYVLQEKHLNCDHFPLFFTRPPSRCNCLFDYWEIYLLTVGKFIQIYRNLSLGQFRDLKFTVASV